MESERKTSNVKRHPIFAAVLDIYFSMTLAMTVVSYINSLLGRNLFSETQRVLHAMNAGDEGVLVFEPSILALGISLGVLILVIAYHAALYKRLPFVSPGEYLVGCKYLYGEKVWWNQYDRNRFGIFLVYLIWAVNLGNMWDSGVEGEIFPFSKVIGFSLRIALAYYAYKQLGRGELRGLGIFTAMTALSGLTFILLVEVPMVKRIGIYTNAGLLLIYLAVYLIYSSPVKPAPAASAAIAEGNE